jgi:hypothetical protein
MRIWLQGKKKTIATQAVAKVTEDFKGMVERGEILVENKSKEEEEKIADTKEEAKKMEEDTAVHFQEQIPEEMIRKEEETHISHLTNCIIQKTKFLLKMSIPKVWDQDDKASDYLMLDPLTGENELDIDNHSSTLGNKLKSFKRIQSSKGTIKNFEEIDSKQIFNSSSGSILAYLQSHLEVDEIQKRIEEKFVNALNRYCGLKIMSNVAHSAMPQSVKCGIFEWF